MKRVRKNSKVITVWRIKLGEVLKMPSKPEINCRGIKNYSEVWRNISMHSSEASSKSLIMCSKVTHKCTER